MSEHLIEIYRPGIQPDIPRTSYAKFAMPVESTDEEVDAAAFAALTAVRQVLGRLGFGQDLAVLYVPNTEVSEEIQTEMASSRETLAKIIKLPNPRDR